MTLKVVGLLLILVKLLVLVGKLVVGCCELCHGGGKSLEVIHHSGELLNKELLILKNRILKSHNLVGAVGSGNESGSYRLSWCRRRYGSRGCRGSCLNGNIYGVVCYELLNALIKRDNELLHGSRDSLLNDGGNINGYGSNLCLGSNNGRGTVLVSGCLGRYGCGCRRGLFLNNLLDCLLSYGLFYCGSFLYRGLLSYGCAGKNYVLGELLNLKHTSFNLLVVLINFIYVLFSLCLGEYGDNLAVCLADISYDIVNAIYDSVVSRRALKKILLSVVVLDAVLFTGLFRISRICLRVCFVGSCYVLSSALIKIKLLIHFLFIFGNFALKAGNVSLDLFFAHCNLAHG